MIGYLFRAPLSDFTILDILSAETTQKYLRQLAKIAELWLLLTILSNSQIVFKSLPL